MAYNENYLFFNEGTDAANATGDGQMFSSSSFLGANVTGSAVVTLHFASRNGAATDDTVAITMGTSNVKLLMQELSAVLSNPRGGLFFQTDFVGEAKNFLSGANTLVITTAS